MSQSVRHVYPLFYQLPPSMKVLFTNVLIMLGFAYILGLVQIYSVHGHEDGQPGLSVHDIQIAYRGSADHTRLEAALLGPMSGMLPGFEAQQIIHWIHAGAKEGEFKAAIQPILQNRCLGCHDGNSPGLPKLVEYQDVSEVTQSDHGVSIATLVRVSHIHLFGLTVVFAVVGFIFSHAYVKWKYVKSVIMTIPFLAIFLDIASWWLTKWGSPLFGYAVVIGGALMAASFAFQWLVSMYQMWFFKCPPEECPID